MADFARSSSSHSKSNLSARFAAAWAVGGVVALATGEAEGFVADQLGLDPAGRATLGAFANVALWWALSGAFRGLATVWAMGASAPARRRVPARPIVLAFTAIWVSTAALHVVVDPAPESPLGRVLLAPMLTIAGVMAYAVRAVEPGAGASVILRVALGWCLGFVVFLAALEGAERAWDVCGLPTEGAGALPTALVVSVAAWALFGATGGLWTSFGRSGSGDRGGGRSP